MVTTEFTVKLSIFLGLCSTVSALFALCLNIFKSDISEGGTLSISLLGIYTGVNLIGKNIVGFVSFHNLEEYCEDTPEEFALCENTYRWYVAGLIYMTVALTAILLKAASTRYLILFLHQNIQQFRIGFMLNLFFTLLMMGSWIFYLTLTQSFNYSVLAGGVFMYVSGITAILDSMNLSFLLKGYWKLCSYPEIFQSLTEYSVHETSTELIACKEAQDQQAGFQQSLPVFPSDLDEISQRQQQDDSLLDFSFDRQQNEGSYLFYQERIQLLEVKNTELEKRLLSLNSHLQTLTLQIQSEVNNKLYLQEECERLRREITHYKKQTDLAEMQCNSLAGEKEQIKQSFRTAVEENKKLRTALKIMHDQVASLSLSLDKLS